MSAAKDVATAIARLVADKAKGAPTRVPEVLPEQEDPVAVLVQSFLLWQSTTEKAAAAYEKIRKAFVDWNDLRVSMPDEVAAVIGVRYPEVEERCQRLRAVLRNLYRREHEMSFASAEAAGKRSIRKYLESLEGMLPYVAERTLLVAFGGHGMPVDETLRLHLVDEGIVDEEMDDAATSSLLLKHVKAADALQAHLALQAWMDEAGPPKASSRTTRKTAAAKSSAGGTSAGRTGRRTSAATKAAGSSKPATKKTSSAAKTSKTKKKPTTGTKTAARKTATKKTSAKTASKKTSRKKPARSTSG